MRGPGLVRPRPVRQNREWPSVMGTSGGPGKNAEAALRLGRYSYVAPGRAWEGDKSMPWVLILRRMVLSEQPARVATALMVLCD